MSGSTDGDLDEVMLRLSDGTVVPLAVARWLGPADETDERLLSAIAGPVLDVGCGPGRHLHALAKRGVFALGVDLSPVAVELARDRGGTAIVGSIFDHVPGAGTWRTALLLDGNIGIGGAPERLLTRIRSLLGPAGEVIVELDPPGTGTESLLARIETRAEAQRMVPLGAGGIRRHRGDCGRRRIRAARLRSPRHALVRPSRSRKRPPWIAADETVCAPVPTRI